MKKLQCLISAILCVAMCVGMVLPAAASDVVTAPAPTTAATSGLSVKEILKDFDKDDYAVVEFGNGGKISLAEYAGGSGVLAEHTVYDGVNATKLVAQDIVWASFAKSHIAFGNNVAEFKNYGYMVVKYASESDKEYKLSVGGWGEGDGVSFTVPAGKAGWTTSEVLTISEACAAVNTSKRSIVSTSSTADTYIGDIVFFKNKADAEEYAKWAPIYLDPNGDATLRRIQKREENWETIKLIMMLIGTSIGERMDAKPDVPPLPFDGIDEEDYYIFDCNRVTPKPFNNDTVVAASFATYYDVDALKLGAQSIWARANSNATFDNPSLPQDFSYAVFRYASESDYPYELGIGWGYFDVDGDYTKFFVPAGNTGWTLSDAIPVAGTSLVGVSKLALASSSGMADTYVADIVLFKDKSDAKRYIEQWNDYYEGANDVAYDPIAEVEDGYTRITFEKEQAGFIGRTTLGSGYTPVANPGWVQTNVDGSIKYRTDYVHLPMTAPNGFYGLNMYTWSLNSQLETNAEAYGNDFATFTTYNDVECIKSVVSSDWFAGNKPAICFDTNNYHNKHDVNNREYAVLTYASETTKQQEFGVAWGNVNGIMGAYPNPDGWMSVAFELTGAWSNDDVNRSKQGIRSLIGEDFYIRELVFFETKEDAEAYAAKAPAYFNGEEYDEDTVISSAPANLQANDIWARVEFKESNVTLAGGAAGTFRFSANPVTASTNSYLFSEGDINYLSGKDTPQSWASVGGRKGTGIVLHNLATKFTVDSDSYIVAIVRSESASDQQIGIYPVSFGNVDLGTIPANTKGWVATTPVNIKGLTGNDKPLYEKLITRPHDDPSLTTEGREFGIYTTAADVASLDIVEIAFLKTKTAADAYAAAATEYYNDIELLNPLKNLEWNGKGDVLVTYFNREGVDYLYADAKSSYSAATFGERDTHCIELSSVPYANRTGWYPGDQKNPNPNFLSFRKLGTNYYDTFKTGKYKYSVVTYATETDSNASLIAYHWGTNGSSVAVSDMSISDGRWLTSRIMDIEGTWTTESSYKLYLYTTDTAANSSVYIHSIAFFEEKDDAIAYVKAAPEYFNGEKISDEDYWENIFYGDRIYASYDFNEDNVTTDAAAAGKIRLDGNGLTAGNDVTYATAKGVSYIACKGTPHGWASNNRGKKGISFAFNQLGSAFTAEDDAWMVAVVRSESASNQVIGVNPVAYGNCDLGTIPAGTKGWVATTPVNVKDVAVLSGVTFYEKLTTREMVLYTSAEDVESLDVQKIIFFKTEEAANAYIAEFVG